MDPKQRRFINTIVDAEIAIYILQGSLNRFKHNYSEEELDEELIEHYREIVNERISDYSKAQQEAMHEYDTYYPGRK